MLHIVCVQKGNYLGRGAEYVNKLHDMVRRNLEAGMEGEFVCFTDNPDGLDDGIVVRDLPWNLDGWWNKLWLFSPGLFPAGDRIIFFDLDTIVIGSLDELAQYEGEFAILRDFYRPGGYQSSVMAWRSGFGHSIWQTYAAAGCPTHDPGGDQSWIEAQVPSPDFLQDMLPRIFCSFKLHCRPYPPKGARVVVFHGNPRPHEITTGWVADAWKVGGIGATEILVRCNTETDQIRTNVEYALSLGLKELEPGQKDGKTICIAGGAPSVLKYIEELKARANSGQEIWALNGAARLLVDAGVPVTAQWIVDARSFNARFVVPGITQYVASQCSRETLDACDNPVLWHEVHCDEYIPSNRAVTLIGGGSTIGMNAMAAAFTMGCRDIHLYGMDSSFDGDIHHAYSQPENDADFRLDVSVEGEKFTAAPWMVRQVEDFQGLVNILIRDDCEISVHCGGLLGFVAKRIQHHLSVPTEEDGDLVKYAGWWRPKSDTVSVPAVMGEVWKLDRIAAVLPEGRRRVAIQAGGHVGIFPDRLSDLFGTVYTFEPDPTNFRCLARNVAKPNVTMANMALGEVAGMIALVEREEGNAGSIGVDMGAEGNIPVVRIDDMKLRGVDLIYLDIEGMEGPALLGALETVIRDKPMIVCENKGLEAESGCEGALGKFLTLAGYRRAARLMRDDVFVPEDSVVDVARLLGGTQ